MGKKLKVLESCRKELFGCVETVAAGADQDTCATRAGARCTNALTEKLSVVAAKLTATITAKCAGLDLENGLRSPTLGLGYATLEAACTGEFMGPALSDVTAVATCVLAQHACRADQLVDLQAPRVQELMARGQVPQALRDGLACLPVHGGTGQGAGAPEGKAVAKCAAAITRGGARFVARKLSSLEKCVDRLFTCEQTKQDNPRCPAGAGTACVKVFQQIATAEQKLEAGIASACPAELYTTMRDAPGANLAVLDAECARYGVADLSQDVGQYTQCLVRQHECRVEELLAFEAPRAAVLIGSVDFAALGLDPPPQFPHDFCPTPSPAPTP